MRQPCVTWVEPLLHPSEATVYFGSLHNDASFNKTEAWHILPDLIGYLPFSCK